MRVKNLTLAELEERVITIGFVDENLYTQVRIDCKELFDEHPDAIPSLAVQPPQGDAYPAVVTREGDIVVWNVAKSDVQYANLGRLQLTFVIGEIVAKSYVGKFVIDKSLMPDGEAPTPIENWITEANAVLGEIPGTIAEAVDDALEEAKESGEFDGADGVSPTVTVTKTKDGHNVVITDAEGDHSFDVPDGTEGKDGVTPQFGIGTVSEGHTADVTMTGTKENPVLNFVMPKVTTEDIVAVQDTQPTAEETAIWFPETPPTPVQVPTYAEHLELKEDVDSKVADVKYKNTSLVNQDGVAQIPPAQTSTPGLAMVGSGYGLKAADPNGNSAGRLSTDAATSSHIRFFTDQYRPITPYYLPEAVFRGLAQVAGDDTQTDSQNPVGTYTDDAKEAIQEMLNVPDATENETAHVALLTEITNKTDELANALSDVVDLSSGFVVGYRIKCNYSIGTVIDLTPGTSSDYGYIIEDCSGGDVFTVTGRGGDAPRVWAFVDVDNKLLSVADAYITATGLSLTAPSGAKKLIFNSEKNVTHSLYKRGIIDVKSAINDINDDIDDANEAIASIGAEIATHDDEIAELQEALTETTITSVEYIGNIHELQTIKTNGTIGSEVSMTPNTSSSFGYVIVDCSEGDVFTVKGRGGDGPRLWAFVDSNNLLLSHSDGYESLDGGEVTAPQNSARAIFNVDILYVTNNSITRNEEVKKSINIFDALEPYASSFEDSPQLFDKNRISEGKKYTNGEITNDNEYCLSDFIEIEPSEQYTLFAVYGEIVYFAEDKSYLSNTSVTIFPTTTITTPASAKYCRLQMTRAFYPYASTCMNKGSSYSKTLAPGKLLLPEHIEQRKYAFSDIPIPTSYSAIGIKAVDGTEDFDDDNPSLSDLYDAYDDLITAYPDYVSKVDLGTDQSGTYHLYAYYFTPEDPDAQSTYFRLQLPKVNLLSGIHGNGDVGDSNVNCFCLYYLMKSICENWEDSEALEYFRWNVRFAILPVQNPWGFENKSRTNSRGVDINRNFSVGWAENEQGSPEYGGTAPLSEAETQIISNFAETNKDALFSADLHSQGQVVNQASMSYTGTYPTCEMFYVAKSLLTKMSRLWDSQNISGLSKANYHGFITGSVGGFGGQSNYMHCIKHIPAMTVEGFKNFTGSPYTNGSAEIVKMVADQLGYFLLYGLNHFRHKQ